MMASFSPSLFDFQNVRVVFGSFKEFDGADKFFFKAVLVAYLESLSQRRDPRKFREFVRHLDST